MRNVMICCKQKLKNLGNREKSQVRFIMLGEKPGKKTFPFLICGNWKMNGSHSMLKFVSKCLDELESEEKIEIILAPPHTLISMARAQMKNYVSISGQNCFWGGCGAFTGELSPSMLLEAGANWVILGHSERREIFGESDDLVSKKLHSSLEFGLNVILCVGEPRHIRENNQLVSHLTKQLRMVGNIERKQHTIVIAYEPIWAIGTGIAASPKQIQEAHDIIRMILKNTVGEENANLIRIIYGGSVNEANCTVLANVPNVDGFLIGGSSINESFVKIIEYTMKTKSFLYSENTLKEM